LLCDVPLYLAIKLLIVSLPVAGSLGGSTGNLGPRGAASASALHHVDVSTQVSVSILCSLIPTKQSRTIQQDIVVSSLVNLKSSCLRELRGKRLRSWLRQCAKNWKVTGSIPGCDIGFSHFFSLPIAQWPWFQLSL
jgi:hypothetical protein